MERALLSGLYVAKCTTANIDEVLMKQVAVSIP